MAKHNELGKEGEQLALEFLKEKGYKILEQNYRLGKAEIDLIIIKENLLIAVEVKTRSTNYFGNPEEFVNTKKKKMLVEAMNSYVIEYDLDVEVRFDIIAVLKQKNDFKIEHIEDAFLFF
ncbi:YraN family protein [uncultured Tenacibaculum sp.]|uniref:YraN family protein n=1 Tax=uncultured Tenacibaculum sp. TaxID=174713 RepID=UPI002608B9DF|nr:YraN family protein [uncultured Tenacibaculum sp.]